MIETLKLIYVEEPHDVNHDGIVDIYDCPYSPGSVKAKLWWSELDKQIEDKVTPAQKAKYGEGFHGMYKGKPLISHSHSPGEGDFDYLVDKLRVTKGMSLTDATKVAASVNQRLYGG